MQLILVMAVLVVVVVLLGEMLRDGPILVLSLHLSFLLRAHTPLYETYNTFVRLSLMQHIPSFATFPLLLSSAPTASSRNPRQLP